MRDTLCIRKYIAGLTTNEDLDMKNADTNGDGIITMSDVLLIRKYVAGLITFDRVDEPV